MSEMLARTCVHHWVLGVPEGDVIRGHCKRCGVRRDFPASVEGASRNGIYDEAAGLARSVELLPDSGPESRLPGGRPPW